MTDWTALLDELAHDRAGLAPDIRERLVIYLTLLDKWTSVTNLVASSTTPRDLVQLHLADCLALLPHLGDADRLVDVGSGGGLPAIPLAIARPALSVTALEPIHKKHAFLATARRELQLGNFTPLAERDEEHHRRADFRPYDAAVSRATFHPTDWLARGATLVRPGGLVLAMEGRDPIALPPGADRHAYHVAGRTRAILVWSPHRS